jgi:hypothetical protein
MLRSIKQLYRHTLGESDGEIGQVKDFYFDDRSRGESKIFANLTKEAILQVQPCDDVSLGAAPKKTS